MRILIDIQALQNDSRNRGIGRHVRDFVAALVDAGTQHEIILLGNLRLGELDEELLVELTAGQPGTGRHGSFISFAAPGPICSETPDNAGRALLAQLIYEKVIADLAPDVVLVGSTIEGFLDDTVGHGGHFPRNYALGSIFYDLIPLSDPDLYLPGERVRAWFEDRLTALRRADFLLTNSDTSRDEAVMLLGFPRDRVHSPGSAVNRRIVAADISQRPDLLRDRFGIDRAYVMHAGAFEPRKNFEGMLREYARLPVHVRAGTQLVFVCDPPQPARQRLERLARAGGLDADQLIVTGFVSDVELVALYAGATVFAFPSLREGFGLPPLEAMSCGTATIASANSSLPEVIGREDALFDPLIEGDLARLLERVLTDASFRASLQDHARQRSRLFDWDRTAAAALAALVQEPEQIRAGHPDAPALSLDAVLDRIAELHAKAAIDDADLSDAVAALAENERSAMLYLAWAAHGGDGSWQIEGPFDSSYSLALVNRTLARTLAGLGHQVALTSTDGSGDFAPESDFLAVNPDLAEMLVRRTARQAGRGMVRSRNLYPPRVTDMATDDDGGAGDGPLRMLHCYAWEETAFPQANVQEFNAVLDLIVVASDHVRKLLIDNGVTVPVRTGGVGVDHLAAVRTDQDFRLHARPFRFLHVSTGLPRKGVDILLDAFFEAFGSSDPVSLVIKTARNERNGIEEMLAERRRQQPDHPDVVLLWDDLSSGELKALHQQCHVAVYPSRAEGFGLPIAEAVMCGLPVIATGWSGPADLCSPLDCWLVDFEFEQSRSHLRLPASAWARPDRVMLAQRLREAFACDARTRAAMAGQARNRILHDHNWRLVAARHLAHIRDLPSAPDQAVLPRIGVLSSWDETCGIATYSRHILAAFPLPVTILAPERPVDYPAFGAHTILPLWRRPAVPGALDRVCQIADRRRFDLFLIQFSFAFYDLDDLAELVLRATRNGVAVVIEMHATALPANEGGTQVLAALAATLARCARVLVHSVADLNRLKTVGLVDNVALLPHGLPSPASRPAARPRQGGELPLVASFGFALPHKGLVELVDAIALLRDADTPMRLRMLNAEFPAPGSQATIAAVRARIVQHGLSQLVECDFTFQHEAAVTQALAEPDLLIFPYQQTDESASGAVRHALASGRPVAVTPIPIFAELEDLVYMLPGRTPEAIAEGVAACLGAAGTAAAQARQARAAHFVGQLSFDHVARRLEGMCTALIQDNPALVRTYPASAPHFRSANGAISGQCVTLAADDALRGPGVTLAPSVYTITVEGVAGDVHPQLHAELRGQPCALSMERAEDTTDGRFTLSARLEIGPDSGPLDLVIRSVSAATRLDRIAFHPAR